MEESLANVKRRFLQQNVAKVSDYQAADDKSGTYKP